MRRAIGLIGSVVATSMVLLATATTTAFAGEGYGGVAGQSTGSNGGAGGGGDVGGLPFTGVDLAWFVIVGVGVVVSGLALRAYTARRSERA